MNEIDGLNERQRYLADLVWSCHSQEDLEEMIESLPSNQDKYDCCSIVELIRQNALEHEHRNSMAWNKVLVDVRTLCKQFMLDKE
jgi:hypothetical protein